MKVTPSISALALGLSRDEQVTLYAAAVARGIIPMRTSVTTPVTVQGIRCPLCSDVVWSRHRHDWRACGCGAAFVDGGRDYLRCGGDPMPEVVTIDTASGEVVEDVTEGDVGA